MYIICLWYFHIGWAKKVTEDSPPLINSWFRKLFKEFQDVVDVGFGEENIGHRGAVSKCRR